MSSMFSSMPSLPSTSSVLSTYTTFAASAMVVRKVLNEVQTLTQFIPQKLQEKIIGRLGGLFRDSSLLTLIIEEYNGFTINEMYQASESYLSTRITPSIAHLKVSKPPKEKNLTVTIDKGQRITDVFEGIQLQWEFVSVEKQNTVVDYDNCSQTTEKSERRSILLSFHKQYKDKILNTYLPYVLARSKAMKEESKVIKLYSLHGGDYNGGGPWGEISIDHPSTFDTIAMDPVLKQELIDDLNRFVKRRDFYRRVGKPWKRGYLLYGPPGTGKSSLIAAMANYLKFSIYDLELTSIRSNSELRRLLTSTANRSILVIEDIDCSIELQDRQCGESNHEDGQQLTLSGLLNFIDGLWSSCGDEKMIVFTTNYKEKLDPALLRPGRMDMHIHMAYFTTGGFRILASNYLKIKTHCLFTEIEKLIDEVEVTPAEVAEELMKGDGVDAVLKGLLEFLQRKKEKKCKETETQIPVDKQVIGNDNEKEDHEMEDKCSKEKTEKWSNKRKRGNKGKRKLM